MSAQVLTNRLLSQKQFWEGKKVELPHYNRQELPVKSLSFSAGRMAYAHTGDILQDLLNKNPQTGLMAGVETFASRYVADLAAADYLMTQLIFSNEKGVVVPKIQAAMDTVLFVDNAQTSITWQRLLDFARSSQIQFATINAPEGAYGVTYSGGEFAEPISEILKKDLTEGTINSDPAKWTAFARARFEAKLPFSFVSCTNFSGNGHVTRATLATVAKAWEEKGFAPKGFLDYILDQSRMGCPNTMIDRIAVSPDENSKKILEQLGIISGIVVTEKTRYWVIEDCFPAGRPAFDEADGVYLEDSYEEVKKYEDMKLRMLNMAHSTIAGIGVLLGYRGKFAIYNAMQDQDIRLLIKKIIDVVNETISLPRKIDPQEFARTTFERLDNANIPDDPMRIALNGSTKMLPRFMDTYFAGVDKFVNEQLLDLVLLPVAGFLRYTLGIDDKGEVYSLEDDPMKELLVTCGKKAKISNPDSAAVFAEIIARKEIMGKNLFAFGNTGKKLQDMVASMISGPGSVRSTLKGYLSKM